MGGDGAVSAYNNAVEAAEWCRKKPKSDRLGRTNFQRALAEANAMAMERRDITSSDLRSALGMKNGHSPAIVRWLFMADFTMAGHFTIAHLEEIDGEGNRADFAALFKGFGVKPTSTDHIASKKRWREYERSMNGGNNAS